VLEALFVDGVMLPEHVFLELLMDLLMELDVEADMLSDIIPDKLNSMEDSENDQITIFCIYIDKKIK
jgi:hypothetical protein